MTFHVHVTKAEEGGFVVSCPALPGCWSQGETEDEAKANILDAMHGWLEVNDVATPAGPGVNVLRVAV